MAQRNITATIGVTLPTGRPAISIANKPDPVALLATAAVDAALVKNQVSAALAQTNLTLALAALNITASIAVQTDITAIQAVTGQDLQLSINTAHVATNNALREGLSAIARTLGGTDDFT